MTPHEPHNATTAGASNAPNATSASLQAARAIGTPAQCLARIASLQRRWTALRRTAGVSRVAAAVVVVLAATIVADALVRGEAAWRWAMLACVLAAAAWSIRRYAVPLWRGLDRDGAALRVERACPELNGRLVTAVQLADASLRARSGTSDALYEAVRETAEASATNVSLDRVMPRGPWLRRATVAFGLVAVAMIVGVAASSSTSIGVRRVLAPWSDVRWPRRTDVRIAEPAPGSPVRVVRGGTLTLAGEVARSIPSSGTLRVRGAGGGVDRVPFDINADGHFLVRYRPVLQDLDVLVEAGDAVSDPLTVIMVAPPEIVGVLAECTDPTYTHRDVQRSADGNVQALFGAKVGLRFTLSKPATAAIEWDDGEIQALSTAGPREVEGQFDVRASRSYRVHLTDEWGFHNDDPVVWQIEMVDNAYPVFGAATPTQDKRVTPTAVLPITADVSDDFGVAEVVLCYRAGDKADVQRTTLPLDRRGQRALIAYAWPIESLGMRSGDTITYWLEARDEGPHASERDWPTSRARRLHVLDEAELARALAEQLDQILQGLAKLEALEAECAQAVAQAASASATNVTDASRRRAALEQTRAEKWRQDRLARSAAQLADRLADVADDYAISRIGQSSRWERLRQTADALSRLASTDMTGVVLDLDRVLTELEAERAPTTAASGEVR